MKIRAEKISKEYMRNGHGSNTFFAVQETDFMLNEGTLTVLTGRSGSGKSTLLNMLCGLSAPTSGKVMLDETDLYALPDNALSKLRNQRFGVIPQGQTALHSLSVIENILLPFSLYRQPADIDAAENLLEQLDIAKLRDVKPAELSGGELRRMAIARAVVMQPAFIFADEPTGDLDDENTETVFRFLRGAANHGAAVMIVTHEHDAEQYADAVFRMQAGQLYPA